MGRQAFRRRKSDGTVDDGTGGGGASTHLIKMGKMHLDRTDYGVNLFWPYISTHSYAQPYVATVLLKANEIFSYPFLARQTDTISSLTIKITTATSEAGALRIAIYDSDDDGMPDSLLGIATPASINTTGTKSVTSFTTNDGSTSATISLTENEKYWVMYGAISTVTDLPSLGSPLNNQYHLPTYQADRVVNGGGYNGRGTFNFKTEATMDTLAKLFPSSWPALSSLNQKYNYNNQASGTPAWIGVLF
jgi:hypothetical protein